MSDFYSRMLADKSRIEDFDKAIRNLVEPNDVVVDLGCGLGTYAMQAARAGAKRVFGVEMDPIIEVARKISELNGLNVEFIHGDARNIQLPEPANVLIFEDYGTGLLDGTGAKLLEVARENWLTKDHRITPCGATLYVAPIASRSTHRELLPFGDSNEPVYGFDFSPLFEMARNYVIQIRGIEDLEVAATPAAVLEHSFYEPLPQQWSTKTTFEFDKDSELDGICLWHDLHLDSEISYSNHPKNSAIWGQYFFPIPKRWNIRAGDSLVVELSFHDAMDNGFWKWTLRHQRGESETVAKYSGNTFASSPITGGQLAEYDSNEIVQLTEQATLESLVLSLVDGKRTVGEICDQVEIHARKYSRHKIEELVRHKLEGRKVLHAR